MADNFDSFSVNLLRKEDGDGLAHLVEINLRSCLKTLAALAYVQPIPAGCHA